ncbi:MAG: hypothetical protein DHS20C12_29230 [Pseudohongiella sp.]|nr:MAG: hypothetical protein DHS20C12_29230 [Pseudohongiella sp.]
MKTLLNTILLTLSIMVVGNSEAQNSISIASYDGFNINARFYPSDVKAPGVLLLHQCDRRGALSGLEDLAQTLASAGAQVLIPDYRTYGGSVSDDFPSGDWQLAGSHSNRDVEAALDYLTKQQNTLADQIAVVGASCGGRYAINLATVNPQVKALVFLSTLVGRASMETYESLAHLPALSIVSEQDPNGATTRTMQAVFTAGTHPANRLLTYKGAAHGAPLLQQDPSPGALIAQWLMPFLAD